MYVLVEIFNVKETLNVGLHEVQKILIRFCTSCKKRGFTQKLK